MRSLILASIMLPFVGCDSGPVATARAQGAELLTDQRSYRLSESPHVMVSLANIFDRVLYIASPSFDTVLDKREGDGWVEIGPWYVIGAGLAMPSRLEPGTYRTWPELEASESLFTLNPGQYRVRTKVYEDEQLERLLPEGERVSAPFEVVQD